MCGRMITRTRKGTSYFRRHTITKGVICLGSWQYPSEQKKMREARIERQAHARTNYTGGDNT